MYFQKEGRKSLHKDDETRLLWKPTPGVSSTASIRSGRRGRDGSFVHRLQIDRLTGEKLVARFGDSITEGLMSCYDEGVCLLRSPSSEDYSDSCTYTAIYF